MSKTLSIALISMFLFGLVAHADAVDNDGERCDRTLTIDSLSSGEKADLNRGAQVLRLVKQSNGYYIGYIFALTDFDAELAMGVYSSCGEHAGNNGLGKFIVKSKMLDSGNANPFRVFYEQQVDFPYDNGTYTVQNKVSAERGGYILSSKLLDASDAGFSPQWSDGYVRMTPAGKSTFVVACNYMVPRNGSWQGKFNDMARDRLKESARRLLSWVKRVSDDSSRADQYRARTRALVGN